MLPHLAEKQVNPLEQPNPVGGSRGSDPSGMPHTVTPAVGDSEQAEGARGWGMNGGGESWQP